jgi:hypothetical protein
LKLDLKIIFWSVGFRLYCSSPSLERHDRYCSDEKRMVWVAFPAGAEPR